MAQGLLRVVSNDQIVAREREQQAALQAAQNSPFTQSLAAHLGRLWTYARDTRRNGGVKFLATPLFFTLIQDNNDGKRNFS